MTASKAPDYCLENNGVSTQREWRRLKRRHLKTLRKAFSEVRRGSVFTPSSDGAIGKIDELIEQLEQLWSPANWGR